MTFNDKQRQYLLGTAGVLVLLFIALQVVFVRPLVGQVRALENKVREKEQALRKTGWPLDHDRLKLLARQKEKEVGAAREKRQAVLDRTTSLFREKISQLYETAQHFQRQVSRLDYQQEFYRIEQKFKDQGIVFDTEILRLSEDSQGRHTYRLVLQLWTLEAVLDKALRHQLKPLLASTDTNAGAMVTVLPSRAFYVTREDEEPYLLEFPVRIRLTGAVAHCHEFLRAHDDAEPFFTIPRMELRKALPSPQAPADDRIEVEFECSAFYLLRSEDGQPATHDAGQRRTLPRGA